MSAIRIRVCIEEIISECFDFRSLTLNLVVFFTTVSCFSNSEVFTFAGMNPYPPPLMRPRANCCMYAVFPLEPKIEDAYLPPDLEFWM